MNFAFPGIVVLLLVGYLVTSIKIINQGNAGIVERLGRFKRTLSPGLNFVIPLIDTVLVESTREQVLDVEPQSAITRDNVTITVDAVMYWRILNVSRAYYEVEDLDEALRNLVVTNLRSEIGRMDLRETVSSRAEINRSLLQELDKATEPWGVQIVRVELQEIKLSPQMQEALERERAAESKRRATISETEGTVESIQRISRVLQKQPNSDAVLQYLVAQRYVDSNLKLGESQNSKIIFMDPRSLTESVSELVTREINTQTPPAPPSPPAVEPPDAGGL